MRILPKPQVPATPAAPRDAKLWKTAQAFESQFLKSMLEQAFSGLSGEGPLGSKGTGADAWRSFLIEEHAKTVTARGGIGIAVPVYRAMQQRMAGGADVRA